MKNQRHIHILSATIRFLSELFYLFRAERAFNDSDTTASFLREPLLTPQFDQPQFDDWINRTGLNSIDQDLSFCDHLQWFILLKIDVH